MANEPDVELGHLIRRLRVEAGLSQRELGLRLGTTQSGVSRLERGGAAANRLDTLGRVAVALDRHLVLSFPNGRLPPMEDAVLLA